MDRLWPLVGKSVGLEFFLTAASDFPRRHHSASCHMKVLFGLPLRHPVNDWPVSDSRRQNTIERVISGRRLGRPIWKHGSGYHVRSRIEI